MFGPMAILLGVVALCIVFVVPIILLVRLSDVCRGIEEVQRRLVSLERLASQARAPEPAPGQVPAPPPVAAAPLHQEAVPPLPPDAPTVLQTGPDGAHAPAVSSAPPPMPVEPTAFERALGKAWNWLVIGEEFRKPGESWEYAAATNWLLRIGIGVVLAGVAFFLKYSIEKGLMGPLGRVALSAGAGVALIVVGVRMLFKKYHLLGQGLTGAGFATLYFAFFAASGMYHLMSNGAAFAMMACVTVAAGVMAVVYQSLLIALLGVVGGYATPLMLGSSGSSALFFYSYVLLLGCGVLGISLVRRWPLLNVFGMLASYGLAYIYCEDHHASTELFKDLIFLSAVHLLYLFSVVVNHLRKGVKTGVFEWAALFLNAGLYWAWAFLLFKPVYGKEGAGLVALAVSAVYVALVYACLKRGLVDQAVMRLFIGLAAVFLAMSPMLMLSGEWLTLAWCLQALVMLWLSQKTGQTFLGKAAVVLFAAASVRGLFFDLERLYEHLRPWSLKGAAFWEAAVVRLLTFGVLPATLTAAWRLARASRWAKKVLGLVLLQVWLYVSLEAGVMARAYVPAFREGAVTLAWTCFAFALLFAGIRVRGKWMRWCGLVLFGLAVAKLLLFDLDGLNSLYRIVAFMAVGALMVLGSFVYLKYKSLFEPAPEA